MNAIRAQIIENLRGRTYAVNPWIAIHGIPDGGIEELKKMQRDGLVTVDDAFGRRVPEVPMYRLSLTAIELVSDTVF